VRAALAIAGAALLLGGASVRAQEAAAPAAATTGAVAPAPAAKDGTEEKKDDEKEEHKGFLFRLTLGLGWAFLYGDGTLEPSVGMRRIEDPRHDAPAFNVALDLGGGFKGLGLHVGGVIERMILRADDPTEMGFTLFGVGGGLSYYFTKYDFYATAQVRFYGLMVYVPGVLCDAALSEKYQWYRGPGVSAGLGKEWFGKNDKGLGLGLQVNYARLTNDDWAKFDYVSVMLALTYTHF
jgi:hypothetical protein